MLKLENTEVMGWEAAIRGMRNPKELGEERYSHWLYGGRLPYLPNKTVL